jgi:hypothetical protein
MLETVDAVVPSIWPLATLDEGLRKTALQVGMELTDV